MDISSIEPPDSPTPADARAALTSQGRGWRGLEAEFRHILAGPTRVAATPSHRLGVHYGAAVNAACRCDGQFHRRVQSHGDADFVPAGFDGEWEDDADCTILRVSVSDALVRQAAEDVGMNTDRMVFSPRFQMRDPRIEHIAWALKAELEATIFSDRLYVDSLGVALAVRLVHLQADRPGAFRPARPTLSPPQKRRLLTYIEAHLDQSLSLADLALVAGIGVSQLKALFPQTIGLPVHQYVMRRRVERAQSLLHLGEAPISQVALEAGFAHQSHMAQCMKRILGVTPRQIVAMRR
ncbi:helix-turn-helix domain-containing protein [Methylocapsa sp. S129]|uniref:helix-turn-helix domain-containing protein n=1 Tax=Methylocapsa sp. S129 TaxID=1641869 RepID=UPI00131D02C7|nr:AraC family transcriptional regulator [Methylocapsa sp. S129]